MACIWDRECCKLVFIILLFRKVYVCEYTLIIFHISNGGEDRGIMAFWNGCQ